MSPRIILVDHGAGNLRSVAQALRHVGADVTLSTDPRRIRQAGRIVVPGQGAFVDCMTRLRATGLDEAIAAHVEAERPYLGICLGLQLLFDEGHEHGRHAGLGLLRGTCEPLPARPGIKLPHMGWNRVHGDPSVLGAQDGAYFYYVHSYHVVPAEPLATAWTEHGVPFVGAIRRGAILACQFHPEKSAEAGLALLRSFVEGP